MHGKNRKNKEGKLEYLVAELMEFGAYPTISTVLYEEIMELTTYGVSTEACRVRPVGMMHANHPTQSKSA